jgi:NAD(P)-dependent dehydrogenase (short-subunit alcohol dehydrogenase family)
MAQGGIRSAIVTGATGAIGGAIARGLLEQGLRVLIVARDAERGEKAAETLRRTTKGEVTWDVCDVGRTREVYELAARHPGALDVLVNNAAECPRARTETPDGIERQWATNVLGYFWMTRAFAPSLAQAPDPRVVQVASYWAGGLDLEDPEFQRRTYDNNSAYRQAKQANRMLTIALAEQLRAQRIRVNACHPGDVRSKLSMDLGFGGHESPEQGAETPVWLATSAEASGATGGYFAGRRAASCSFSKDREQVQALYAACGRYDRG